MFLRASKDQEEPVHASMQSDLCTCFPNWFYSVRHSGMGCVLLYLSMFSCFKPNCMRELKEENTFNCLDKLLLIIMSKCMRFPTMWYVRPAKPQISLRIRAV